MGPQTISFCCWNPVSLSEGWGDPLSPREEARGKVKCCCLGKNREKYPGRQLTVGGGKASGPSSVSWGRLSCMLGTEGTSGRRSEVTKEGGGLTSSCGPSRQPTSSRPGFPSPACIRKRDEGPGCGARPPAPGGPDRLQGLTACTELPALPLAARDRARTLMFFIPFFQPKPFGGNSERNHMDQNPEGQNRRGARTPCPSLPSRPALAFLCTLLCPPGAPSRPP